MLRPVTIFRLPFLYRISVLCLEFSILNFQISIAVFRPGGETRAPIIGATCAFDAKIYKNVGGNFDVSACGQGNKKNFRILDFCSALPSLLIDFSAKIYLFYQPQRAQRTPRSIKESIKIVIAHPMR
ncbi:MAG: hypothetical protein JXA81_00040 [Sedimentisphaerales bacterium]|nr:hypothetical protein [Sedimentisphaerales bacterium]